MKSARKRGFTLSETILVLGLFGIIAASSIPKIMVATQNAQRNLVFKETIAAIDQVLHDGMLWHEFPVGPPYDVDEVFIKKFNTLKSCHDNALDEGCWNGVSYLGSLQQNWIQQSNAAMILPNGVMIANIQHGGMGGVGGGVSLLLDWNGDAPPNRHGDDQLMIRAAWSTWDVLGTPGDTSDDFKAGKVGPVGIADDIRLWNQLYGTSYPLTSDYWLN